MRIENVVLPNKPPTEIYDVEYNNEKLGSVTLRSKTDDPPSTPPSLLLPPLCHPHIHLDKPFLLTSRPTTHGTKADKDELPDYSDLTPKQGSFQEALKNTGLAKTRYTKSDLILRGSQLIAESCQAGVTSMRAFVEIDHVTQLKCIEAGVELKQMFKDSCHVQICAFAQDPIMSTEHGEENLRWMNEALDRYKDDIEVLGSTPYVEETYDKGCENIEWAVKTAIDRNLHVDFHLDYNLDGSNKAMIWDAIRLLRVGQWKEKVGNKKRIVFGHCSRMTLFSEEEMQRLASECSDLPVAFVGLPTSDLFMMGRLGEDAPGYGKRDRGTLQVIDMIKTSKLDACIGANNVGNAFTPWGSVDPLQLACLGVGLYHAGTEADARLLYECVSSRARRAIGIQSETGRDDEDFDLEQTSYAGGMLCVQNDSAIHLPGVKGTIPSWQRLTIKDVVWNPPDIRLRCIKHR